MRIEDDSYNNLLKLIDQFYRVKNPDHQKADREEIISKFNDSPAKIWSQFDLQLNYKNIIRLLIYLNENFPLLELPARQEAFALLLKNNLPLIRELIDGVAINLSKNYSLTGEINKFKPENVNTKETVNTGDENVKIKGNVDLKRDLLIKLNPRPELLIEELKNYPDRINQAIQFLATADDDKSSVLLKYLLGQQLLNMRPDLPLFLELPLLLPHHGKTIPAYLQINREKSRKRADNSKKKFQIKLIISLEKLGTIYTDLSYHSGQIELIFSSNSSQTRQLIKRKFNNLHKRLKEIGLKVKKPVIQALVDKKERQNERKKKRDRNYIHIDLRV